MIEFIMLVIILAISIGLHEYAHAITSYSLGDPTPKLQGRLTPNPLAHIDPLGFMLIFLVHFGRGKPVQINPYYYKNPLRDELIVALAGPATNIIMSFIGIVMLCFFAKLNGINSPAEISYSSSLIVQFRSMFSLLNIGLAVFNMLPMPPLDGYRLIKIVFPRVGYFFERNMFYMTIFFLIVLFSPGIGDFIRNFIGSVTFNIYHFFFVLIGSMVFY